jgi:hypothetical protein
VLSTHRHLRRISGPAARFHSSRARPRAPASTACLAVVKGRARLCQARCPVPLCICADSTLGRELLAAATTLVHRCSAHAVSPAVVQAFIRLPGSLGPCARACTRCMDRQSDEVARRDRSRAVRIEAASAVRQGQTWAALQAQTSTDKHRQAQTWRLHLNCAPRDMRTDF